jgi:hypothetical protein
MLTVHAQPPHELVVLGQNDGVFVFGLDGLRGYLIVIRQFVLLRAGTFTLLATDTHRGVIKQGLAHENCSSLPSATSVLVELGRK